MTKDVITQDRVIFRLKSGTVDATPHLEAMAVAGIGKNNSDRIRICILAFTKAKRLKVPPEKDADCTKAKIKLLTKGAGGKTVTVSV